MGDVSLLREIVAGNSGGGMNMKPWEIIVDALYDVGEVTHRELTEICLWREDAEKFNWNLTLGRRHSIEFSTGLQQAQGLGFIDMIHSRDTRYRISEDGRTVVEHWRGEK